MRGGSSPLLARSASRYTCRPTQASALRRLSVVNAVILLGFARVTLAHPLAPALLELTEHADRTVAVRWKTSLWTQTGVELKPALPPQCTSLTSPRTEVDATSVTTTWTVDCGAVGLVGSKIRVNGAEMDETDTLLRIELTDGRVLQAILRADEATYTVPRRSSGTVVFREYGALGLRHILNGFDHLLFVFGLVLLVPDRRALVKTVTAFTAGHSVTLSMAALGYATLPQGPIEALIAVTILALATELARPRPSFLRRFPWAIAFAFGLLHGLGFAGALREIGLPAGEIPIALLSFNLGIELGQLLFIALVLLLRRLTAPLVAVVPSYAERVPVYVMGSLAAFWVFERAAALL